MSYHYYDVEEARMRAEEEAQRRAEREAEQLREGEPGAAVRGRDKSSGRRGSPAASRAKAEQLREVHSGA